MPANPTPPRKLDPLTRRRLVESAVVVVIAACVGYGLASTSFAREVNRFADDAVLANAGKIHEPRHVVLVAVDEPSLNDPRLRDVPLAFWAPHFATAIRNATTAGARVVGVDFLFSTSATDWLAKIAPDSQDALTYNTGLSEELAKGRVILIAEDTATASQDRCIPERPAAALFPIVEFVAALPGFDPLSPSGGAARHIGLANVVVDEDGVVRRYCTHFRADAASRAPPAAFSTLLAEASTSGTFRRVDSSPARLAFAGPPGTFPRVSFAALLDDDAPTRYAALLRNRIAIIGADYVGAQDFHETPYSRSVTRGAVRWMTGAEIHANVAESLIERRQLADLPIAFTLLLMLLVTVAVVVSSHVRRFTMFAIMATLMAVSIVIVAVLAFRFSVVFPAGALLLQLVVAFSVSASARLLGVERQREVLRSTFEKYVSPEVLTQLEGAGVDVDLAGTRPEHEVTVLFSDVRDFTTISEMLPPGEVVALLNDYFTEASKVILANNGTIFKFIGDAVMVVFGNPVFHDDHALRACRTALELQKCADRVRERARARFAGRTPPIPEFRIGVGLHTGNVVVGNIGSPERLDYTAIGDTVNTAARLEGLCKSSETGWRIVASLDTINAARAAAGEGRVITGAEDPQRNIKGRRDIHVCELIAVTEIVRPMLETESR